MLNAYYMKLSDNTTRKKNTHKTKQNKNKLTKTIEMNKNSSSTSTSSRSGGSTSITNKITANKNKMEIMCAIVPFTLRKITLLTPAPILFFASHRKCPCASFVIFLKCNDPLPYSNTFGSYKNSLYSPGVAPIAFPIQMCVVNWTRN